MKISNIKNILSGASAVALVAGALVAYAAEVPSSKTVTSDIINSTGKVIGDVTLTQGTEGVLIHIRASGLPAGYHGMHFHAVGACSGEGFASAGGHVMPGGEPHGYLNPEGPHAGNLPNLIVAADGTVEVELYSQLVSLESGEANLLDKDGSTLIIHTDRDDHFTQPIGGAGGRIACAVIK